MRRFLLISLLITYFLSNSYALNINIDFPNWWTWTKINNSNNTKQDWVLKEWNISLGSTKIEEKESLIKWKILPKTWPEHVFLVMFSLVIWYLLLRKEKMGYCKEFCGSPFDLTQVFALQASAPNPFM